MPIFLYWGEDDFALDRAALALRQQTLDPDWASFNFDRILPDQPEAITQALNQAMTPPFGNGDRLVWLVNTSICQRCSEELLQELERTLPNLPDRTTLLLTTPHKPDGRLKSTKLLQKHASIREFSPLPPWKTDLLIQQVRQVAQALNVKLTAGAAQLLAESVGSNSRQLFSELEKLSLYTNGAAIDETAVARLVTASTQNSLQLADAIRQGQTAKALTIVSELFRLNEPPLGMVKTLVGRFRLWLWVKLLLEAGERDDREIAKAAEINNPKQLYYLQQDVRSLSLGSLQRSLPLLLELEFRLKMGSEPLDCCQTKMIELCALFPPRR